MVRVALRFLPLAAIALFLVPKLPASDLAEHQMLPQPARWPPSRRSVAFGAPQSRGKACVATLGVAVLFLRAQRLFVTGHCFAETFQAIVQYTFVEVSNGH